MGEFVTKIDYSNNRQIRQDQRTITDLSGGTVHGVSFSALTTGPDPNNSGITTSLSNVNFTFSGNTGTTNFTFDDTRLDLGIPYLSAITDVNSGTTQNISPVFTADSTTIVDGNTVALSYSGINYQLIVWDAVSGAGPTFTGSGYTSNIDLLSAATLDFTGRTIWTDVKGILRTEKFIMTNNPTIGYVLTCSDTEGLATWMINSSGDTGTYTTGGTYSAGSIVFTYNTGGTYTVTGLTTGTSLWYSGTGSGAVILDNATSVASSAFCVSEGYKTTSSDKYAHAEGNSSIANGESSHAEGNGTSAGAKYSHVEGNGSVTNGESAHAEGNGTNATGNYSHAEGSASIAIGIASHAEGSGSTANGQGCHAGGIKSITSGESSFNHSYNDITDIGAFGNYSAILGGNNNYISSAATGSTIIGGSGITATTAYTTYVESFNIKTVGAGPGTVDLGRDGNGNVVDQASDISLKENILTIGNALDKVLKLRGVEYNWKDRKAGGESKRLGLIAQEAEEIVPELIYTSQNGLKGVNYKDIPALLIEAIKEIVTITSTTFNSIFETQTVVAEDNNIELNYGGNHSTAIGGGLTLLNGVDSDVHSTITTIDAGDWVASPSFRANSLIISEGTPTSSDDTSGRTGEIKWDDNYLYIKTNNGIWKRTNLERF